MIIIIIIIINAAGDNSYSRPSTHLDQLTLGFILKFELDTLWKTYEENTNDLIMVTATNVVASATTTPYY